MGKTFKRNYIETLGADFSYTSVSVNNASIRYSIWDLAGSRAFEKIHPQYFMNALGTIVVYDLTVPQSMVNVNIWLRKLLETNPNFDSVVAIVGNKSDLIPQEEKEKKREELDSFVEKIREKYGDKFTVISHITSALNGEGVNNIFDMLGQELLKWVDTQIEREEEEEKESIIEEILLVSYSDKTRARIISSSPYNEDEVIVNGKVGDANDLGKLFNFKTSKSHNNFFSVTPWKSTEGIAYTITRVVDEEKASNNNEFVYLSVIMRAKQMIPNESKEYLYESLSLIFDQIERIILTYRADFNATDFNPLVRFKSARLEISKLLDQGRDILEHKLNHQRVGE